MLTSSATALEVDYLTEAHRIGERLVGQLLKRDGRVSWQVRVYQTAAGRAVAVPAPPTIYQGRAGTGLFLAELGAATNDDSLLATASLVLRQAAEDCCDRSFVSGLYSGTMGVAMTLARLQVLAEDHSELIQSVLKSQGEADEVVDSFATDVISGRAGSILGALYVDSVLDCESAVLRAIEWGDELLTLGREGPFGMSWPSMRAGAVKDLCGYAHGAAGIGHALGELWARTGERRFQIAAERAISFEDSAFDNEQMAWPDHRHMPALTAAQGAPDQVSQVPGFRFSYMSAWCHGAPGIGMARVRLASLVGDGPFHDFARAALDRSMEAVSELGGNWSLCHGIGGNLTACLDIASALNDEVAERTIGPMIRPSIERFGGNAQTWPCGTLGRVDDPSLMVGTAGVGWAMLRLAGHDALPILCVPASIQAVDKGCRPSEDMIRHVLRSSFPRTARSLSHQAIEGMCVALKGERESDPTLVRRMLDHMTMRAPDWGQDTQEALAADRHSISSRLRPQDRIETMKRTGASDASGCFFRQESLRLFPEPRGAGWTAALPVGGSVVEYRCGLVEAAVLQALTRPMSLDELCLELSTRLDTGGDARSILVQLRKRVRVTLATMQKAGLVRSTEAGSQLASVIRKLREEVEVRERDRSEIDIVVEWLTYCAWHSYDLLLDKKRSGAYGVESDILHMVAGLANRLARVGLWRWFIDDLGTATSLKTSTSDRLQALDRIIEGLREILPQRDGIVSEGEVRWGVDGADDSSPDSVDPRQLAGLP